MTTEHDPNRWRYSWPLDEEGRRYVVLTCPCGVSAAGESREDAEQALSAHVQAVGTSYRVARGGVA